MAPPLAVVRISLAQSATDFVAASIDLLIAAEQSDQALVTDEVREAAEELRAVIERGNW